MARALILALVVLLTAAAACTRAAPNEDDRAKIERILDADKKLDVALKEADDEAFKGNETHAADLLDGKCTAAADEAIRLAEAQAPATQWGMDRKAELLSVLHERRDNLSEYAKALRSDSVDAKLSAFEKQAAVEKRTMDVVMKASKGP